MKTSFTPSKDCFNCGSTDGRCRESDNVNLCMNSEIAPDGFKYIGRTKCGIWAKFIRLKGNGFDKGEWQRQKAAIRQQREQEEAKRKAVAMPAHRRDRYYRQLLEQLTLHPIDRADLHRRGLTEAQIKAGGFKSVEPWQKLEFPLPITLPGVNIDGQSLNIGAAGYLIPILDNDGLIVGLQMRLRDASEGGRYRWVSSKTKKRPDGPTPHLPNGELPLAVFQPEEIQRKAIVLVEGTGAKPLITSHRLRAVTIGAAGGQFSGSKGALETELKKLSERLDTKIVEFFPDGGSVDNKGVTRQYNAVWSLLEAWGYEVRVAWWGQTTKQHPDIDELEDLSSISFITPTQFIAMAIERGYEPSEQDAEDGKAQEEEAWEVWRESKKFTPTHTIDSKYFDWAVPPPNSFTFVKSGLGSGKSKWVGRVVKALDGEGFIALGTHNNLMIQSSSKENWDFYHLKKDDGKSLISDPNSRTSACIDSIIYWKPQDFEGKNLILDEVSSLIKVLMSRDTAIAKWREQAKRLFREALSRAKRVIALDGNLKDWECQFLLNMATRPDAEVVKVANTYQGSNLDILFYEAKNESYLRHLILTATEPIAIVTDSKLTCQELALALGEERGIRLDGDTSGEPWAEKFLEKANGYIQERKPRYVVLSPSGENGLDISIMNYFTGGVFAIFHGVIGTDAQLQMLGRIRDPNVKRHVWSASKGLEGSEITKSFFPAKVAEALTEYLIADFTALTKGMDQEESLKEFMRLMVELRQDEECKVFSQLLAIDNFERKNLRACLKESLKKTGHHVETSEWCMEKNEHGKEELKDLKAKEIFAAPNLSPDETESLKNKGTHLSWADQCSVQKNGLRHRLPGIDESPSWDASFIRHVKYSARSFISRLEALWLFRHPEVARALRLKKWDWWRSRMEIDLQESKSLYLKISTLIELGFGDFLVPGNEWSKEDPKIERFHKACKRRSIALKIGMEVGKTGSMQWLNQVLESFGLKTADRETLSDGKKVRLYRVVIPEVIPDELAKLEKRQAKLQKECDRIRESLKSIRDKGGSPDMNLLNKLGSKEDDLERVQKQIKALQYTADVYRAIELRYAKEAPNCPEIERKFLLNFMGFEPTQTHTGQGLESIPPLAINISNKGGVGFDVGSIPAEPVPFPTPSPSPDPEPLALPPSSETVWQESRSRLVEGMRVKYMGIEWKVLALGTAFASLTTDRGYRIDTAPITELQALELTA